jgi:hypothetical protein
MTIHAAASSKCPVSELIRGCAANLYPNEAVQKITTDIRTFLTFGGIGIDPAMTIHDRLGRPLPRNRGKVIQELYA